MSLTSLRSGLADRVPIRPRCVSSIFTPVLSCGEMLSCYHSILLFALLKSGLKGGSAVANIKGHSLTPYSTVHSGAPWEANPYSLAR